MPHSYSDHELFLLRRGLRPGTTSAGLMAQVKALEELSRLGTPVPLDRVKASLESIAANTLDTYQSVQGAAKANRLLDLIAGHHLLELPSDTPLALASADYWPYDGSEPEMEVWLDQDMAADDTEGLRDQWRTRVHGPPPWTPGQVRVPDDDDQPPEDDAG